MDAVDVHAHYLPPAYLEALDAAGQSRLDGNAVGPPAWSVAGHLALADEVGIATSILSISSPGLLLGDRPGNAVALAPRVNDQGAEIVRDHDRRFGLFASLPLPDLDAALDELARAYDDLHADGVSLLSNYAGVYPADERFAPLFGELSRREAVVALHPTSPPAWEAVSSGRSRGTLEFMFDAARAAFGLVMSGTLDRHPGIRLIVPHAGGVVPLLADRVDRSRLFGETSQVDVFAVLGRLFYDLAGGPLPRGLPALLSLAGPGQLLYGSDYPFHPESFVHSATAALRSTDLLGAAELDAAFSSNALNLFPRLRAGRSTAK
jgi:predicted TIM-barrel fold metal-dependent hydrolase